MTTVNLYCTGCGVTHPRDQEHVCGQDRDVYADVMPEPDPASMRIIHPDPTDLNNTSLRRTTIFPAADLLVGTSTGAVGLSEADQIEEMRKRVEMYDRKQKALTGAENTIRHMYSTADAQFSVDFCRGIFSEAELVEIFLRLTRENGQALADALGRADGRDW